MGDTAVEVALSIRAEHAEGPLWDAATARLWWVDITGQRVHCFDPATGNDSSWATAGQPGGVVLERGRRAGRGQPRGPGRARPRAPARWTFAFRSSRTGPRTARTTSRPTAGAGPGSARWPSTSGPATRRCTGSTAARRRAWSDGLTICNGPAFDEPQGRLYLADTALFVVDVFDLDPATGALTGRRRFLDFTDAQVWPDGMTVDDEGMLWVALGRAGAVHRYRADGTLDGVVELPDHQPHLGGLRRHRRRRPVHHDLMVRLRTRQPRRPAPGRRDLPLPPRGDRAPLTAVRGRPATGALPERDLGPLPTRERRHRMIERMVLFGASGDLTSRLLMPAIAQLAEAGLLPPGFTVARLGQHRLVNRGFPPAHRRRAGETRAVAPATRDAVVRMLSFAPADVTQAAEVSRADRRRSPGHAGLPRAAPGPAPVGAAGLGGRPAAHLGRGRDREALRHRPGLRAAPQRDPAPPAARSR